MGPEGRAMPSELKALVENFGSVDAFKDQSAAGAGQFGSGWCWLVKNADGSLAVTKTEMASTHCALIRPRCWAVMYGNIHMALISATSALLT